MHHTQATSRSSCTHDDPDTEEQLDRVSGDGWVAAKDGDYADALTKGHTVILLVTESTGAFSADLDRVLRQLARTARASGSIDHTPYGTSRASTRSHYTFHSAAISAAIVTADALTIQNSAAALGFELTLDPRDLARRSSSSRPPLPGATTSSRPPRSHRRAAANATDPTLLPRPRPKCPRQRSPRAQLQNRAFWVGLGCWPGLGCSA